MYKEARKILFAIIFAFSFSGNSKAQTYVLIPDANFVTYLQGLIPSAMSGNSLNITSTLVTAGTQTILCSSLGISDLTGIQYFSSLNSLNCSLNSLTSLPTLPNSLTGLYCSYNSLTSLPTLPTSLRRLECINNSLTSLPTLPNTFTVLACSDNSLTSLPTLPNTLIELFCSNNSLTSLPTLPNSITYLECCQNFLTSLPTLPSSLIRLDCCYNSLTSLPTLPNTLSWLSCFENSLTSLPALPNSITTFLCSNNNIKCFPVFPASIVNISLIPNPFNCLPNYVLPAMSSYTAPLCQVGNSNGCNVIGIKELSSNIEFIIVYPNPSSGSFKFRIDNEIINGELVILSSLGQRVHEQKVVNGVNYITIDEVSSGIYQYVILQNKQEISRGKLIIE